MACVNRNFWATDYTLLMLGYASLLNILATIKVLLFIPRLFYSERIERIASGNKSHTDINKAATNGPTTKPFKPNTAKPPRVEINTM